MKYIKNYLERIFFNKKKLLLAFEYGVILCETAKERGEVVTPEMVERAEAMVFNEFKAKGQERLAIEMIPNILSVFEKN